MDQASGFVSRVFFQMPALADFFRVLDHQSTVTDKPDGKDIGRAKGDVDFEDVSFSYDGLRPALAAFHRCMSRPARRWRSSARPAPARARRCRCCTACGIRSRASSASTASTIATSSSPSLRRNIGVVFQDFDDVLPLDRRQSADRQARRHPGRARGGGQARRGARLHHAPAARLRDPGRRARHHAVGRRAPAAGDRPGAAQEPADPDPRRGDQRARRGDRGAHPEGAQGA